MADGNAQLAKGEASDKVEVDRRGTLRPRRLSSARRRVQSATLIRIIQLGDLLAWLGGSAICRLLFGPDAPSLPLILAPIIAAGAMIWLRAYEFGMAERLWRHHFRSALALVCAGALAESLPAILYGPFGGSLVTVTWILAAGFLTFTCHAFWFWKIRRWRSGGRLKPNVVLVGATEAAEQLIARTLENRSMHILGIFDDRRDRVSPRILGVPVLGTTHDLIGHRILPYVDRVVVSLPLAASSRIAQMLDSLAPIPNPIALLAHGADQGRAIERLADVPLTSLAGAPNRPLNATIKRVFDFVCSLLAIIVLAPAMILIACAVRLDSPGPVLFKQRRHGFLNEEVVVWKFRSMKIERADATASLQVTADDDRVTRLGKILRRTSLDELPQLINVIRGEMSVVGPRPHAIGMQAAGEDATKLAAGYAHRHRIKPGMTGWAAINGSRGPADTPEAIQHRVALDLEYVERQSFWFDLWIIMMTVPCLFGDRDVVR